MTTGARRTLELQRQVFDVHTERDGMTQLEMERVIKKIKD
jgi:hypothetical protein